MFHILIQISVNLSCCHTKPGDSRYIVCSGTHATLLSATKNLWNDLHFFVDIQKTDTLRTVNLVSADCKKIDPHTFRINVVFTKSLNCIDMIQCLWTLLMYHLRNLFDWHHSSDFIIYKHGRYHDRIWS